VGPEWTGREFTLAPLRQEVAAMKPHFNSLSFLSASDTVHDHKRRWDSECIVPSGCRIRKMCLSAAQTDSGARLTGSGGEVRRRSRTCARKATTLAPLLLRFVGARGFEPRPSSVSRNERHAIYLHKRSLICGIVFVVVRHLLVAALCFAGFPRDGIPPRPPQDSPGGTSLGRPAGGGTPP